MKTLQIIGDNHFDKWAKHRTACRGGVINGGKVLLSYEEATDQYGIPGGGMEDGETIVECCCREIAEETGRKLTAREQAAGMIPKWVDIKEAIAVFSKHQEYAQTDEEKRGIYLREYMALREFEKRR